MDTSPRALVTTGAVFLTVAFAVPALAVPTTERVSVATDGAQADGGMSLFWLSALSRNGRFVAFESDATNLVLGDSGSHEDVFVRDRDTDRDGVLDEADALRTVRVSVSTGGAEGNGFTWGATMSADGRSVGFVSLSSNLVSGDGNNTFDVFVRDRDTDRDGVFDEGGSVRTRLASASSAGAEGNRESGVPVMSGNGRFLAFGSTAANLVGNDRNRVWDAFVRDRDVDRDGILDEASAVKTRRVSLSTKGAEGNRDSEPAGVSANGRFVVIHSFASNLVSGDTNGTWDVFVRDRNTDRDGLFDEAGAVKTVRISMSSSGVQGNGASLRSAISDNGRFVAFQSSATNLVAGDTNGSDDIFVRDRDVDRDGIFDERGAVRTRRVSLPAGGGEADWWSGNPSISGSGRFVGFASAASNLVADDTNGATDGFVRDRDTDLDGIFDEPGAVATIRVSVSPIGTQASGYSTQVGLSGDGRWAAFSSGANDVVEPDLNPWNTDVFVRGPLP
jgi:hypothetical protein